MASILVDLCLQESFVKTRRSVSGYRTHRLQMRKPNVRRLRAAVEHHCAGAAACRVPVVTGRAVKTIRLAFNVPGRLKDHPAPMRDRAELASGTDDDACEPIRVDAPVATPNQAKGRHAR
jgi:hypothetical protein